MPLTWSTSVSRIVQQGCPGQVLKEVDAQHFGNIESMATHGNPQNNTNPPSQLLGILHRIATVIMGKPK